MESRKDLDLLERLKEDKINTIFFEKAREIIELEQKMKKENKSRIEEDSLENILLDLYDMDGRKYSLTCNYQDKSTDKVEIYSGIYHLESGEDINIETEASIFVVNTCKCCDKVELSVNFKDGEDINHYIIISELNGIIEDYKRAME